MTRLRELSRALDRSMGERAGRGDARWQALRHACPALAEARAQRLLECLDRGALGALWHAGATAPQGTACPPRPGDRRAGHVLEHRLGRGGMAQVWRARPLRGGAAVALKLPRLELLDAPLADALVQGEREALARLAHANVVRLADGVEPGAASAEPCLALQLVSGLPIDVHCRRGDLSVAGRARLVLQLLAALEHAHGRGVVHGDVKPANVLVRRDGRLVLLDFGIAVVDGESAFARAGFGGYRAMSLRYASPEQRRGERVGAGTDVWAAGLLLADLLRAGAGVARAREGPVDAAACRVLRPVVERAVATAAAHRYPTAGDFAEALREALGCFGADCQAGADADRAKLVSG